MAAAPSAEENKQLVRSYYERFQEGEFDALEEVLADDYTLHGVPGAEGEQLTGREAVEGYLRELSEAFPDMTAAIDEMIAEGETVAYRATITGTHEGEFMGISPTGEEVTVDGEGFFRVEDGKLAEAWPLMDTFGMMQQLGVIEAPGE